MTEEEMREERGSERERGSESVRDTQEARYEIMCNGYCENKLIGSARV